MRITDNLRTEGLLTNIEGGLENLNKVQEQIATGKKMVLPSDDPAGASQSLAMRAAVLDNTQYNTDAVNAKSFLSASDSALSDVNNLIVQARQIAVQGANTGAQDAVEQASLASQVDGIIQQITQDANSALAGKYLFSGTATHTAPYLQNDPTHAYQGNTGAVTSTIGPHNTITINTPGSAVFAGLFQTLESLKANLSSGNTAGLTADVTNLDAATNTVSAARATIGTSLDNVTTTSQSLQRANNDYQDAISNVEDVDLAQAYVQLQSAQNVYQASLVTTQEAFKYSLADYLN